MCESTVSEEPIDADDLLEDPRTDAEALCLCGLLWAPADAARQVVAVLTATDFHRPIYGELFDAVAAHVQSGTPRPGQHRRAPHPNRESSRAPRNPTQPGTV